MNIRPISEWTLYRLRFAITYSLLAVLVAVLLLAYGNAIPPGLGPSEQQSLIMSSHVSFTQLPTDIIDLPYHALQKLSVEWLGVTPMGVRLPSLVFGAIATLCIVLMLRRWFSQNVAILASVIFITSTWFLSLARLGSPEIMIVFWTSVLLLTATYVTQQTKNWKWWRVAFAMAAALSMYTPFMVYLFAAAALASLAQPHLRYLLRESNQVNLFIGGFFFTLILIPLGWGIYHNPDLARVLLAVPAALPEPLQFLKDFAKAASSMLNPFNISIGETITPMLNIVSVILLLVGAGRLLRDFHSVRAHVLLIWAAILMPIIAFNPNNLAFILVPAILVITIGLNQIIRYWYTLFPRNPYAKLFGILPLTLLAFSMVQVSYQHYTLGMLYSAQAGATFKPDAFMAQREIEAIPKTTPVTLVVPETERELYQVIASRQPGTVVASGAFAQDRGGTWIVAPIESSSLASTVPMPQPPTKMLVNDRKEDSLRFVVYNK